jgi:hypothetical protein
MKRTPFTPFTYCLAIVTFLTLSLHAPAQAPAQNAVTNEQLYEMLGAKAHSLMADQHKRLRTILEGFLLQDWARIERPLNRMKRDLEKISAQYAAPPGKSDTMGTAFQELERQVDLLAFHAKKRDYAAAYGSFSATIRQCIECHEARRTWGTFSRKKKSSRAAQAVQTAQAEIVGHTSTPTTQKPDVEEVVLAVTNEEAPPPGVEIIDEEGVVAETTSYGSW